MSAALIADRLLAHTVNPLGGSPIMDHTPEEIRLACQELIARDHTSLAIAVGEAAYSLYPANEDILSITALMAVSSQDWSTAIDRMNKLLTLQGLAAREMTYILMVRAQRCNLDPAGALRTAVAGLQIHPTSSDLLDEVRQLKHIAVNGHEAQADGSASAIN